MHSWWPSYLLSALAVGAAAHWMLSVWFRRFQKKCKHNSATDLIGNTPLIRIASLSKASGCTILAKCEFLNPGGSPKDRVALAIMEDAEREGLLIPDEGYTVYEGTVGSTGIALAWIARAKGYHCHICIPDDQSKEKYEMLERLGAQVEKLRPAPIIDAKHFCNAARSRAKADPRGYFADQFDNLSNFRAHYNRTGPELWQQTEGQLNGLVLGAGTGGTLAGCSRYLKEQNPEVRVVLADPQGSGLANKVKLDVMYASTEAEGTRRRHQVDTIVEGVGTNRMTLNLEMVLGRGRLIRDTQRALALLEASEEWKDVEQQQLHSDWKWIDDAETVSDREAVAMARWMIQKEGLFLDSSSCVNLVAVMKTARKLCQQQHPPRETPPVIVTMLCDAGQRHLTKFWNDDVVLKQGIVNSREELEGLSAEMEASFTFVQ